MTYSLTRYRGESTTRGTQSATSPAVVGSGPRPSKSGTARFGEGCEGADTASGVSARAAFETRPSATARRTAWLLMTDLAPPPRGLAPASRDSPRRTGARRADRGARCVRCQGGRWRDRIGVPAARKDVDDLACGGHDRDDPASHASWTPIAIAGMRACSLR